MAELTSASFPTHGTRVTYVTGTFPFIGSFDVTSVANAVGTLYHIIPGIYKVGNFPWGLMEINGKLQHQECYMKPVHEAAYTVDPKYEKSILSGKEIKRAYTFITAIHHLGLMKVLGSLVKSRTKPGLWEGDGIWQSCQHT